MANNLPTKTLLWFAFLGLAPSCGDPGTQECTGGIEGCPCVEGQCLGGGQCIEGICTAQNVDEAGDGDGDGDSGSDSGNEGDCGGDCPDGSVCTVGICEPLDCTDQPCPGLSYCDLATSTCAPGCAFDEQCNNGTCDLSAHTCICVDGYMPCGVGCVLETEICDETCGNDQLDPNEVCDGTALAGVDCADQGFVDGTLLCNADCTTYTTSECWKCGDSELNPGEECDVNQYGGATCASLGFEAGDLVCKYDCTFDTSGCNYGEQPASGLYSACLMNSDCSELGAWGLCSTYEGVGAFCTTFCFSNADCQVPNLAGEAVPTCAFDPMTPNNPGFCELACGPNTNCPGDLECIQFANGWTCT